MFKLSLSLITIGLCLINIPMIKSTIKFDPIGVDTVHPIESGCLPSDDFTKDINDETKFYRCADGVQNSMHCAPGTVFDGLTTLEQMDVVRRECGFKKVETTRPMETTRPIETTRPMETTRPIETTRPMETTRLIETTRPMVTEPYVKKYVYKS